MLGLGRIQVADEGHDGADRQDRCRGKPLILTLDGGNERGRPDGE